MEASNTPPSSGTSVGSTREAFRYAGGAGILVGLVLGSLAVIAVENAKQECTSGACAPDYAQKRSVALGLGIAADASFAIGLVCAAIGWWSKIAPTSSSSWHGLQF
jgi:hypothetical protein